jgi:hypothetical protein
MKRPVGVILTALVQVLGSLVVLLFSILMLFTPALLRNAPSPSTPLTMPAGLIYGSAAMYGVFGVLGILTAVGLFRLKNWARYSTLMVAAMLVLFGLIVAMVFVLMPMPAPPAESGAGSPGAMNAVKAVMACFSLSFAVLGAIWLYYFNRSATKEAFTRDDAAVGGGGPGLLIDGRRVPLSIVVIGVMDLLGSLFLLPMAFWTPATMFAGVILTGFAAKAVTFLTGAVGLYVGVGLLRLSNIARLAAIALHCWHIVNVIVMVLIPSRLAEYMRIFLDAWSHGAQSPAYPPMTATLMRASVFLAAFVPLVVLYFLVTRANAFRSRNAEEVTAA